LRALFDRDLTIDDHLVVDSILPIWSLTWIVQSWAAGLDGKTCEQFLDLTLRDLVAPLRELSFVRTPSRRPSMEPADRRGGSHHADITKWTGEPDCDSERDHRRSNVYP
jgi:hypothetical protein